MRAVGKRSDCIQINKWKIDFPDTRNRRSSVYTLVIVQTRRISQTSRRLSCLHISSMPNKQTEQRGFIKR